MLYKNVVLLDLFLYSTFLAFTKSIVKVSFISLCEQRNEQILLLSFFQKQKYFACFFKKQNPSSFRTGFFNAIQQKLYSNIPADRR